jgi:hypothetical protein
MKPEPVRASAVEVSIVDPAEHGEARVTAVIMHRVKDSRHKPVARATFGGRRRLGICPS